MTKTPEIESSFQTGKELTPKNSTLQGWRSYFEDKFRIIVPVLLTLAACSGDVKKVELQEGTASVEVKAGDTLTSLAKTKGVTVAELKKKSIICRVIS